MAQSSWHMKFASRISDLVFIINFEKILNYYYFKYFFCFPFSLTSIPIICMLHLLRLFHSFWTLYYVFPHFIFSLYFISGRFCWHIQAHWFFYFASLLKRPPKVFFISITVFFEFYNFLKFLVFISPLSMFFLCAVYFSIRAFSISIFFILNFLSDNSI